MTPPPTPYDELPYRSFPIEWTAPERLALTSLLHGGPRQRLEEYRVLELGCGDGTNLIPMAYYRRHATFVGIDSAYTQIAVANEKRSSLQVTNITFVSTDFESARRANVATRPRRRLATRETAGSAAGLSSLRYANARLPACARSACPPTG